MHLAIGKAINAVMGAVSSKNSAAQRPKVNRQRSALSLANKRERGRDRERECDRERGRPRSNSPTNKTLPAMVTAPATGDMNEIISMMKRPIRTVAPTSDMHPSASDSGRAVKLADSSIKLHAIYRAQFAYVCHYDDDMNFEVGDKFLVHEIYSEEWAEGTLLRTQQTGKVPLNYFVLDEDTPQSHDAWNKSSRNQAELSLLMPGVSEGTYIIRPCSKGHKPVQKSGRGRITDMVVISVRTKPAERDAAVVHYKVVCEKRQGQDKWEYYMFSKLTDLRFDSFSALVNYYGQEGAKAMKFPLLHPYSRQQAPPNRFRDFEVVRKQVELIDRLGKGNFGEVFRARYAGCLMVAVKTLLPGRMSTDEFLKEARVMHTLRHPNIVQLLGVCTSDSPYYIITELMPFGSLLDYMHKDKSMRSGPLLVGETLLEMLANVATGMQYLEEHMFIHRDLRAANILVGENNVAKVADFGLAKVLTENVYKLQEDAQFPVKWTAPEAINSRLFSTKSDVWSFGVLAYEVCTRGDMPYQGMDNKTVLAYIQCGGRLKRPVRALDWCPEKLYNCVMLECWRKQPDDRPTFENLTNFLNDYIIEMELRYK